MAIAALRSSPQTFRKLRSDLAAWVAGGVTLGLGDSESVDASPGIPVYEMDAEHAASGRPLAAARQTCSRHLLHRSGGACYADMALPASAGGERLLELVCGDAADRLLMAVQAAAEAAGDGDYQARILEVPSCDVTALWLAGISDKVVPMVGIPGEPVIGSAVFLDHVREIAAARRRADTNLGE